MELRPDHQAAVIEIGIDEIGAMEKHAELVAPTAALLTSIGPEHLEKLKDVPTVAREEAVLLRKVAASGGIVAVNLDDPYIRPLWDELPGPRKIGYALGDGPTPKGSIYHGRLTRNGLSISGQADFELPLPLPGRHNAMNLLGVASLAHAMGLSPAEILSGLTNFRGADGRSQVRELPGGPTVICDYYNASPPSVAAGLDLLAELSGGRRARFACLADMLELGSEEERFHRELAPRIITQRVENVFLFGQRMLGLADELRKRGFAGRLEHFPTRPDLARALAESARKGDVVLIKGSHSMKMEEVFQALQSGPGSAT
jgi:UDP-N-acetylmuramoyl-tripeptide--D-alanyl-D-alanine ligase